MIVKMMKNHEYLLITPVRRWGVRVDAMIGYDMVYVECWLVRLRSLEAEDIAAVQCDFALKITKDVQ